MLNQWLSLLEKIRQQIQKKPIADDPGTRHPRPKEPVVNSPLIKWEPVDRTAAIVVAPALWIHKPNAFGKIEKQQTENKPKRKKRKKPMKGPKEHEMVTPSEAAGYQPASGWMSQSGLRVQIINGEPHINADDVRTFLCEEIARLPKETRPNVKAAEDARRIMNEMLEGVGGDMEKFRSDTKRYLEDIRQTRFAVVTETSQMTTPLRELRQFFLGSDYKEQVGRLREFVDLCERLEKLKENGTLDGIADTMLRLAVKE